MSGSSGAHLRGRNGSTDDNRRIKFAAPSYLRDLNDVLIQVSSVLSFVGCAYILYRFFRHKTGATRDITTMLVATLAAVDLWTAVAKFPATSFTYSRNRTDPKSAPTYLSCQVQGFFIDFLSTHVVLWNAIMAFNLLRWVVYRDTQEKMRRRYPWYFFATAFFCLGWTFWLALPVYHLRRRHNAGDALVHQSLLGPSTFFCWIADPDTALYHFYTFVFAAIIFMVGVLVKVRSVIRQRAAGTNYQQTEHALLVIQRQLYLYVMSFLVLYLPISVYRISDAACDASYYKAPTFCMQIVPTFGVFAQTLINLQGFVNAVIFGGFLSLGCKRQPRPTSDSFLGLASPSVVMEDTQSNMSHYTPFDVCDRVSIYASTFNMAEGAVPTRAALAAWIPRGHDVYVIGLQECLALDETRSELLTHLETTNNQRYTAYHREIGSKQTTLGYHGYIAIAVYVATSDVECGRFEMFLDGMSKVHRGKSLIGMGRASNKGAVGFAFRYFDTTFAVASCHLASDSSGKSKMKKRHKDAASILRSMNLQSMGVEFDFQHMVHHTIFMGDLNYRLTAQQATPTDVLKLMVTIINRRLMLDPPRDLYDSDGMTYGVTTSPGNDTVLLDDMTLAEHDGFKSPVRAINRYAKDANWTLLLQHDELVAALQTGAAFAGFSEAMITFAPTFRRALGTQLPTNRRLNIRDLQELYTTILSDGGLRVPSYTDRILYHSLPDLQDKVRCVKYFSCEDVTTSDHKPVASIFHVAIEKSPRTDDMVVKKCTVSVSNVHITWASPLETMLLPPSPDVDEDDESPSLTASPLGPLPHSSMMSSTWASSMGTSSTTKTHRGPIVVRSLFPLPSEDDFAESRELNELAEQLTFHSGYLCPAVRSACQTTTLKQFEATGVKQSAVLLPKKHMHLALNFQSSSSTGYSIGQCVIGVVPAQHRRGRKVDFQAVLTSGGRHMGEITGRLSLKMDVAPNASTV
ncbi:hypothetical protein, variant [Saprolegnia diclina VS20]|uniref:G-protein coupled receptors family 1 profile domain-containing protein n=1 Tax=Saprolegnia diclina (strain VS20) TaxID=1156394 RepID=T0QDL1_SAPDV|nr:hypothetical protein, variant [Saprolegnia diclina VS20]EQC35949.1 hypothetical protein, variant [Saprolegnia diclina VS20]|eukprot:XP_008610711.1 hypothetical protein, variant [Saprolegnia diclina VS20]